MDEEDEDKRVKIIGRLDLGNGGSISIEENGRTVDEAFERFKGTTEFIDDDFSPHLLKMLNALKTLIDTLGHEPGAYSASNVTHSISVMLPE